MVLAGPEVRLLPRRAAKLLSVNAADLVTFEADDVAALASFTSDPADGMLKLSLALGIRPD